MTDDLDLVAELRPLTESAHAAMVRARNYAIAMQQACDEFDDISAVLGVLIASAQGEQAGASVDRNAGPDPWHRPRELWPGC